MGVKQTTLTALISIVGSIDPSVGAAAKKAQKELNAVSRSSNGAAAEVAKAMKGLSASLAPVKADIKSKLSVPLAAVAEQVKATYSKLPAPVQGFFGGIADLTKTAASKVSGLYKGTLKGLVDLDAKSGGFFTHMGKAVGKFTASTLKGLATVSAAAATALLVVGKKAISNATAFEKQMSNVATLLDGDVKARVAELSDEVLAVSNATGMATADLTDGLYQVVSAFGDSADAASQLEIAAKAAIAGNASTTDSINMLSSVTKGYGDTSAEAMQKAADLAFETVKLGQTTFPELASSIGRVIPLAQTMGVTQEELFGATATLTGVTGGTAEVMTQLRGTMQGFLTPTDQMTKAIKRAGYANATAMLESEGLQGTLELLKKSVGGNEMAFANLFGSVEAKNAVLALTGAQAENLTEKTQAMYEATGAANRAFEAQTDNVDSLMGRIKNLGQNTLTSIGLEILPVVKDLAEDLLPVVQSTTSTLAPILKEVFATVGPLVSDVLSSAVDMLAPFMPTLVKIGKVMLESILPPLIKLAEGVLPIFSGLLDALLPIIEDIFEVLGPIFDAVVEIATPLIRLAAKAITPLYKAVLLLVNKALKIIRPVLESLKPVFNWFTGLLSGVVDFVSNVFTGSWSAAWQSVKDIFGTIWEGMKALFKAPVNWIIGGINKLLAGLNKIQVPDWVPFVGGLGFDIQPIPLLARGGFTKGPSIAGEAGQEAVISFNSAYRQANLGYWQEAGERLGALDLSGIADLANAHSYTADALPRFATGGFTQGPSLVGESGREAVISFDPRYRQENLGYLAVAGRLLGMDDFSLGSMVNNNVRIVQIDNLTYAPVYDVKNVGEGQDARSLARQAEADREEFGDWLCEWIATEEERRF